VISLIDKALISVFGEGATFRDGQKEAVEAILNNKRVLVVQRTGWGKSLVYFLATKLKRAKGEGVTLIISPLLSLMRNQIESVYKYGLTAAVINSTENSSEDEMNLLFHKSNNNMCDIIFVTPERLDNPDFIRAVSKLRVGMLVVDEAHCISDWGHDFRPDYRRINKLIPLLPNNIAILATTATATSKVIEDIQLQIGRCEVIRGPLMRESIHLHKVKLKSRAEKFAWLEENIKKLPGSGIVYATTINECNKIAHWLKSKNIEAEAYYSSGISEVDKAILEIKLRDNKVKVLISTIALGMGFDKDDLSFVIHYYTPKSVVEYYQQVGRAGRAIDNSYCVLLYGDANEDKINNYFIDNSFPKTEDFIKVLRVIEQYDSINATKLYNALNIKKGVCDQILKLLSLEGYIIKEGTLYSRTVKPYAPNSQYYEKVINNKKNDYIQMLDYQNYSGCLMKFLTDTLDDPHSQNCGKCSNCLPSYKVTDDNLSYQLIEEAKQYLDQQFNLLKIKKQSAMTKKKLLYLCSQGFALCYYNDELGQLARKGKYVDNYFSDTLVNASVQKIRQFLAKEFISLENLLIVPIPSINRPSLVSDFSKKLAESLGVKYFEALVKTKETLEQKNMLNPQHQEFNVRSSLKLNDNIPKHISNYNILLIDDFVDSGWTFTVAAEIIGSNFSNEKIIPFAIAITGQYDE
jgi:ATP-dependent DNA helicase RecQ